MKLKPLLLLSVISLIMTACSAYPDLQPSYDPVTLRFDGGDAIALEREFVTRFPYRASGQPNSQLATEWLNEQFTSYGWTCQIDQWEVINYSRPTTMRNVICRLPGKSPNEILVVAHHDIARTTVEGASNDGSGIAILLQLAEGFATEDQLPYTLVFVATDGEEYGMIGTGRYIQTHPDKEEILAGISIDNQAREYHDGMSMELIGQYRRYGPIWLALTARQSARMARNLWPVYIPSLIDQITGQAAPISFMDQGPIVAAGIPAIGFTSHFSPEFGEEDYQLWHDPGDTMEHQSPVTMEQSGRVVEALIRQLQSMESFPEESGPYLYFDSSQQVLRGFPLWLIFADFVGLFFLGSAFTTGVAPSKNIKNWRLAIPHFLSLWLPLLASIFLLYLFTAAGLMDAFARYPATTKDPYLLNPRWPAVILFLLGLSLFFYLGRWLVRRYTGPMPAPAFGVVKSFALFIVGLGAVYVLMVNPFSLLFFLPLLFWSLIGGRKRLGKALDLLFFILGGLVVYALIYFFGFVRLRYDFAFLWFMLNMFSTQMISFPTAAMITAIIAAGLSMLVRPATKGS